jgi:hypothetical protein
MLRQAKPPDEELHGLLVGTDQQVHDLAMHFGWFDCVEIDE